MAFTSAVTKVISLGPGVRQSYGTWANGAATDSGGTISTGLKFLRNLSVNVSTHVGTQVPKVTLNSPAAGQAVIVTSVGGTGTVSSGTWVANGA